MATSGKAKRGTRSARARSTKKSAAGKAGSRGKAGRRAKSRPVARATTARRAAAKRPRTASASPRIDPLRTLADRIVAVTVQPDDEAILALYAADVESSEPGQPPMVGLDALKQKFEMWRAMTSSASFRPRNVAICGNTILVEWEGTVTLAANGKTVAMNEVAIHEIADGRIVRERYYYDPAQLQG